MIKEEKDITLTEMVLRLRESRSDRPQRDRRLAASARLDFQKKAAHALEHERPDLLKRRQECSEGQLDLDPARLAFIDETGLSTKICRLRG